MFRRVRCPVALIAFLSCYGGILSAETATVVLPGLPPNARLALCGDSITEQMLYTRYVEAYILACAGRTDVSVFQFGWGGENADQFRNRINRGDLDAFGPTAVTIAYGANDGGSQAWQEWMQGMWTGRMTGVLTALASRYPATAASTIICAPTCFQANSEGTNAAAVSAGNATLARFRDIDIALAKASHTGFADFHQRMRETGAAAQAVLGAGYRFGGSDGVHAGPNGQLMMAYEVLKSLGFTGGIATITVDLLGGANASVGHVVTSAVGGVIRLSSSRYPFCYNYDHSAAADRLATILPYLPFSQDFNRFTLVVGNLGTAGANVTWGDETRSFTGAELGAGVNLAAAFVHTPFDRAFANLMHLIAVQQVKERDMIKAAGDATAPTTGWTPADVAARNALDAAVHAALVAVDHVISIVPIRAGAAVVPVVSSGTVVGTIGVPFSHQITAVNGPTDYAAVTLPSGLIINATTGLITGTPMAVVSGQAVAVSATNAAGTGAGVLTLTINAATSIPVVTSAATANGNVGSVFSHQIAATNHPTKFYATGLPAGLNVDAATGRIAGTPSVAGSTSVLISAENAGGAGSAALVITITPLPVR